MNNYFDYKLSYNGITFQLTNKSIPDEREIHTYHEILYYIDGVAELLTENSRHVLRNQSLLIIPKQFYHFIRVYKDDFLRLKISIPENTVEHFPVKDVFSKLNVTENLSTGLKFTLSKLQSILKDNDSGKNSFYAYTAFLMLLAECDALTSEKETVCVEQSGIVSKIIQYISDNLAGDLSIPVIADKVNTSPSGVIHSFKKEMGISLHNYVIQKRLIYARELIAGGHKLSKIYSDCGYVDYSSFYRAYVKFFGHPPSDEKDIDNLSDKY